MFVKLNPGRLHVHLPLYFFIRAVISPFAVRTRVTDTVSAVTELAGQPAAGCGPTPPPPIT
jgi:hypothetical protein